jgi:hypothetical protein
MRYLLLFAFSLLAFVSCEKTTVPATREDELRDGRWRRSNLTLKVDPFFGPDTLIQVYDSVLQQCEKDDYIVFRENYQATQNNGDKCSPAEPDEIPFSWELADNGEKINLWFANETFFGQPAVSAPFVSYTSGSFVIRYVELVTSQLDFTKKDTLTFTYHFTKF